MTETEAVQSFWRYQKSQELIEVVCLVPVYGVIELDFPSDSTFKRLKENVYKHIKTKMGKEISKTFENYQIMYVSENTCHQEVDDDDMKLGIFRFIDPEKQSSPNKNLDNIISKFNVDLDKASAFYKDIHLQRLKLASFASQELEALEKNTSEYKFVKKYPQQIKKVDGFSTQHQSIIVNQKTLSIHVYYKTKLGDHNSFVLEIPIVISVGNLKQTIAATIKKTSDSIQYEDFTIKIAGKLVFITGEYVSTQNLFDESTRFIDYVDIQNKITNNEEIAITIITDIKQYMMESPPLKNNLNEPNKKVSKAERNNIWNLEKSDKLNIIIKSIETDNLSYFMLKIGLFYGDRLLDSVFETKVYPSTVKNIEEIVKFEIPLNALPLNTKISIVLYGSKNKNSEPKPKYMTPEAWVNVNLYDHSFHIDEYSRTTKMYTTSIVKINQGLNPLGTCIPPYDDKNAFLLEYSFSIGGKSVFYPLDRQMKNTLSRSDSLRHAKKTKRIV